MSIRGHVALLTIRTRGVCVCVSKMKDDNKGGPVVYIYTLLVVNFLHTHTGRCSSEKKNSRVGIDRSCASIGCYFLSAPLS